MQLSIVTIGGLAYLLLSIICVLYYLKITFREREALTPKSISKLSKEPLVSIIVPTFNEEQNIRTCLRSLRLLDYSNYEIIVADGGSKDKTIELAKPLADKIVVDDKVPDGWIGKCWGCHLGAEVADGEILLFTDADTFHQPDSLRKTVSLLVQKKAGLLTMLPYQKIEKWWESIVPVNYFLSNLTSGGLKEINDPGKKDSFMGSGQYLLFKRTAYEKIGGHQRIKGSIVEDLAFACVIKQEVNNLLMINNNKLVSTRMYPDSFKQLFVGWKKCLYAGTKLTPPRRITLATIWVLWTIFTPATLILSVLYGNWLAISITSFIYLFTHLAVWNYWKDKGRQYWMIYPFLPIWFLIFIIIIAMSALELTCKQSTTWRGRKYQPNLFAGRSAQAQSPDSLTAVSRISEKIETAIPKEQPTKYPPPNTKGNPPFELQNTEFKAQNFSPDRFQRNSESFYNSFSRTSSIIYKRLE
ncbi:MAG: glycosyltransferase [Candidatus Heimdallarchaeota archaeon]|nr:glycosyltransferase [Candidatus Heimdallarchaeota archaeon]